MRRKFKTRAEYRAEEIVALRQILANREIHDKINDGLVQYAEDTLRRYGVPEKPSDASPETRERQEQVAAAMRLQQPFDARMAQTGEKQ